MPGPLYAGIDLGTSRAKLRVYDEEGRLVERADRPEPLHKQGGKAWHDPEELKKILGELMNIAREAGARAIGVSLYRASVAAWRPGGEPVTRIILWLDRDLHRRAADLLPLPGRIARRLPIYNRVLAPWSPLPLIGMLHRENPGARVWTADALLLEWLGHGYKSEPAAAALTGAINPASLRPVPLALRLAGASGLEVPEIGYNVLEPGPHGVSAMLPDQQAALVGLGCGTGCVKLSLGTGFFADTVLPGKPPIPPPRGLVPLVVYRVPGETRWGLEALAPGAGYAVDSIVRAIGGWGEIGGLSPEDCKDWPGAILIPVYSPHPAFPRLSRPVLVGPLSGRGRAEIACAAIMGAVGLAVHTLHLLASKAGRPSRIVITGGLTRLPLIRALLGEALPGPLEACPEDLTPRGVAALAARAVGLSPPQPPECAGSGGASWGESTSLARLVRGLLEDPLDEAVADDLAAALEVLADRAGKREEPQQTSSHR